MEALLEPLLRELGYEVNSGAKVDFTAWRMRTFYRAYRELKQAFKRSPLARFVTCMDRFDSGFLDRETAYFENLQRSADRPQPKVADLQVG
jgi:hypothetical protein